MSMKPRNAASAVAIIYILSISARYILTLLLGEGHEREYRELILLLGPLR